jgi:hypothetical protein
VNLSSLQFEEVTSEAVERIIRAKNVIIYGVPESNSKRSKRNVENSYLYHKARKCYFASASTVCGAEAALVRALAKHFLAV